jgi:hypothetical protein
LRRFKAVDISSFTKCFSIGQAVATHFIILANALGITGLEVVYTIMILGYIIDFHFYKTFSNPSLKCKCLRFSSLLGILSLVKLKALALLF